MKNCSSLQIKAENKISSHASKAFRVRFASRCEGARFGIQEVARQRNRRGSPLSQDTEVSSGNDSWTHPYHYKSFLTI